MNPANKATMLRIILIPFFVACFYIKTEAAHYIAFAIFLIASLTDLWDGWYARKHNLVTNFGKLMDPMADKLLYCTAFILFCAQGTIGPIVTIVFIARELVISAFRLIAAERGVVIAAGKLGKAKTALQFVALSLLLLDNPIFRLWNIPMDQIMVYTAAFFTVISCAEYIIKNKDVLKEQ